MIQYSADRSISKLNKPGMKEYFPVIPFIWIPITGKILWSDRILKISVKVWLVGREEWFKRCTRNISGVLEMVDILYPLVFTQVYTVVKTEQLRSLYFIPY